MRGHLQHNEYNDMSEVDLSKAAGYKHPSTPQSWTTRDTLLFANSIGVKVDELHLLYELHPDFQVFPTYPVLLPFRHADDNSEVTDFLARSSGGKTLPGVPKLNYQKIVDGERYLEVVKPLPKSSKGYEFELQSTTVGVYDKGKAGLVLETEQKLVDKKTGEVYTKMLGSAFAVGQGGYNGPKGPKKPTYKPPTDRKPDFTQTTKLTEEQALLYRLNADYNPLHADPKIGKAMGFPGVILHGLCTWNHAAVHVLRSFSASQPAALKSFEARFAAPVLPGQTLVTEMWDMGSQGGLKTVIFTTKVQETGKLVLANGRAVLKDASKSKL